MPLGMATLGEQLKAALLKDENDTHAKGTLYQGVVMTEQTDAAVEELIVAVEQIANAAPGVGSGDRKRLREALAAFALRVKQMAIEP